jgi:hypothetical protein
VADAEERARQAEIDAARARELAEEYIETAAVRGADALPGPTANFVGLTGRMMREWIRGVLLPPAVRRMYDIGMGTTRFEVPTMAGNVVSVPAPASVQVKALQAVIGAGLPSQVGLVDGDGETLPGVFALGALDLDSARRDAHGERYMGSGLPAIEAGAGEAAESEPGEVAEGREAPLTRERTAEILREAARTSADKVVRAVDRMADRVARGEFEVVEVEEGVGHERSGSEDKAPGPLPPAPETTEQRILRERRERRERAAVKANGNGRRD